MATNVTNGTLDYAGEHLTSQFVFGNPTPTLFMCSLYLLLGTLAMFSNILDIFIFFTNNELRRKYMFFIALDFGELIDGLCYFLTAVGRGSAVLKGTFGKPISFHECFFERYWVHALIMGTELPALITIVIATERIIAVQKPKFYSSYITTKTKMLSLIAVGIVQLCFLTVAGFSAYHNYEESNTRHCAVITSTATYFSTFHFTFVISAYVVSFISLLIIYVIHKRMKKNATKMYGKKKDPQLALFLSVTGTSIILVSMPSIVMIGIRWHWWAVNDIIVGLTYSTTGFLSITNTFLNFIFRPEYRSQLKRLLKLKFDSSESKMFTVTVTAVTAMKPSTRN
ncbi:hypothetical protein QR680_016429 [Steinernema hermaphroditum]|uniref:G-protein coupled receptors family 1 profile domain-containing protein n=1 Tax=Steinernema hermaphroditum TaxID=289476 RepID=A0AA39HDC8_9BILA|nr:hypothetical protein QR680_016429 [Steinernema hermaphroditum]